MARFTSCASKRKRVSEGASRADRERDPVRGCRPVHEGDPPVRHVRELLARARRAPRGRCTRDGGDVLPDPRIRQELSAVSSWPTIPQVFVRGELIGGADIVEELALSGELERTLEEKLGPEYRGTVPERVVTVG